MILGHGRHGKDTVAEILRDYHGITFESSSHWAAEHVIWPLAKSLELYGGKPAPHWEWLYANRHREDLPYCGRKFWFDTMKSYNGENGGDAICRGVLSKADVYVGMRSRFEYEASCKHFDHVIWVHREGFPPENSGSMELDELDAEYTIRNTTLHELWRSVDRMCWQLKIGDIYGE